MIGKMAGFSLHAGVAAGADERDKLERLCRYISRPAVSEKRLSLTSNGQIRYRLKTPYRDGTTHVIFHPGRPPALDFIARLAALVPKPRVNLTRFHGIFASNSKYRALITPSRRGKGRRSASTDDRFDQSPGTSSLDDMYPEGIKAQRLKRVFNIDIETCRECGGSVRVIACIEDPVVVNRILEHLKEKGGASAEAILPEGRAPPSSLFS
jgi:hypothetical protein